MLLQPPSPIKFAYLETVVPRGVLQHQDRSCLAVELQPLLRAPPKSVLMTLLLDQQLSVVVGTISWARRTNILGSAKILDQCLLIR